MMGKLDKIAISYNVSLYVPLITFQLSWNYSVIRLWTYNNFYHENCEIIIIRLHTPHSHTYIKCFTKYFIEFSDNTLSAQIPK